MPNVLSSEQRRILRLRSYLAPYPSLKIRLVEQCADGVRVLRRRDTPSYVVEIAAPLLTDTAPDWLEPTILRYALLLRESDRSGALAAEQQRSSLREEILRLRQKLRALLAALQPPATIPIRREPPRQEAFDFRPQKRPERRAAPQTSEIDAELTALWRAIREHYFPDRPEIDGYRVIWSYRKHSFTLASCNVERRRVAVAHVMQLEDARPFLDPLLYHEMCHAVLGIPPRVNGRRQIHGREFKELERRHPGIQALDAWIRVGGWRTAVRKSRRRPKPTAATSRSR